MESAKPAGICQPTDPTLFVVAPALRHRDPLDQAAVSFDGMCCLVRPDVPEPLGILCVWHDERASYQAVLAPRPYKRRPEQIVRVRRGLWDRFVPAVGDLFGQQTPDHVCLHLIRRRDNPKPDLVYVPLGRSAEQILHAFGQP